MSFSELLKNNCSKVTVIAPATDFQAYMPIDLSESNSNLHSIDLNDAEVFSEYILKALEIQSKKIAYGGYLEKRLIYNRSSHFKNKSSENQRDIHLGLDFWSFEGTAVMAALDGRVHSFKNNKAHGDYGPTIILEHHLKGVKFFTLYGHLSLKSIKALKIGIRVHAGEVIGDLGAPSINGDYPPHLHFQIVRDLEGNFGDYPGVCTEKELDFYAHNCPDPNLLLKL